MFECANKFLMAHAASFLVSSQQESEYEAAAL